MDEFTIGIEEEYLLVDIHSRNLAANPPTAMMKECQKLCTGQVYPELLRSQIEIGTRVCHNLTEAKEDLIHLRQVIADVAAKHGLAPIAASTHPFAHWSDQIHTPQKRYANLVEELQAAALRMLTCGMHVHIGIPSDELRIDMMNQLVYFLPYFLALSCSSPFWEGSNTGLKSYRITVFDALPRTGLPERFTSFTDYERHTNILVNAGLIENPTKVWWDLRPSARYPTLETRIMDVCTNLEDTIAITALLMCILHMLQRLRKQNQRWRIYSDMLIKENRWRAMRYSFDEGMLDLTRESLVPFPELMAELLETVKLDAIALGCTQELSGIKTILKRGTSAHRQIAVYEKALKQGASNQEALKKVVDFLIEETSAKLTKPAVEKT